MSFVKTENISKIYVQSKTVQTQALNNINLNIAQGEFVVISGPSGSGKTTLLNILGGLDAPTNGKVFLHEHELTDLKEKELALVRRDHIGFIFQAYNLIPVLTALENIEYIMVLQGVAEKERREKATRIAEQLEIAHLLNKRPNEMSGGQQQRVAIARSLVSSPDLILADEPTANLDSKTGEKLLELMRKINEEQKMTFVFSTHDKMIMDKAKRRIVLKDGQIINDQK